MAQRCRHAVSYPNRSLNFTAATPMNCPGQSASPGSPIESCNWRSNAKRARQQNAPSDSVLISRAAKVLANLGQRRVGYDHKARARSLHRSQRAPRRRTGVEGRCRVGVVHIFSRAGARRRRRGRGRPLRDVTCARGGFRAARRENCRSRRGFSCRLRGVSFREPGFTRRMRRVR